MTAKKFFLSAIRFYQKHLSFGGPGKTLFLTDASCRFIPTCSQYTYQAIAEYGTIAGLWLGFKRIIRCHPLSKGGADSLPNLKFKI